jgi:hypothetical protein
MENDFMVKKKPSLKTLRNKAWKLMSLKVRGEASDHRDHVICVTCGKDLPAVEAHAGHFIHISKQHPLSYDKRNIHPQCVQCNYYKSTGIEYFSFMHKTYGPDVIAELIEMKHRSPYLKRQQLEDLCITLSSKS